MYELLHELQNESELEIDRKSPVSYKKKQSLTVVLEDCQKSALKY